MHEPARVQVPFSPHTCFSPFIIFTQRGWTQAQLPDFSLAHVNGRPQLGVHTPSSVTELSSSHDESILKGIQRPSVEGSKFCLQAIHFCPSSVHLRQFSMLHSNGHFLLNHNSHPYKCSTGLPPNPHHAMRILSIQCILKAALGIPIQHISG